jgi:membrane protein implicated in regulation of membrane protease activity
MLTLYLVSATIGLVLILLSVLGVAKDADVHADADPASGLDLDGSSDTHVEAGHGFDLSWLPFLSLRFWTYFFGTFGLSGISLTALTDTPATQVATMSAVTGMLCGVAVAMGIRYLRAGENDSNVSLHDMLGSQGTITVPIRPGLPGKIRAEHRGEILDFTAVTEGGRTLEHGERAIIVAVDGQHAQVVPVTELFDEEGALRAQ